MKVPDIRFDNSEASVDKILNLQQTNLRQNLTKEEADTQGFVFVQHDRATLHNICQVEPAVVAFDDGTLAGYAICMTKKFSDQVPELKLFFEKLDRLIINDEPLGAQTYLACGQICIAKEYRGQNLIKRLYQHMKSLNHRYMYCVTEISTQNIRSLYAHYKVGFKPLLRHEGKHNEVWEIVLWEWNQ